MRTEVCGKGTRHDHLGKKNFFCCERSSVRPLQSTNMARSAKNRQQDPVPLEQKERKAAKVRSGGKWKRVDAQGKLIKPPSKKGAAANTDADEQAPSKKSKKAAAKKGGGGSGSESEDEELDAARAAFFDDEDLDEGEGGFEGREDDLDLENGSDAGFESNDSYDLEDEPLEGEPENGLDSEDVYVYFSVSLLFEVLLALMLVLCLCLQQRRSRCFA